MNVNESVKSVGNRQGIGRIEVGEAQAIVGEDPHKTPLAHAVVPATLIDEGPTSSDILVDERVERLLRENYELLRERKGLREAADMRATRAGELLGEARKAKRLVREFLSAKVALERAAVSHTIEEAASRAALIVEARDRLTKATEAVEAWAAESL